MKSRFMLPILAMIAFAPMAIAQGGPAAGLTPAVIHIDAGTVTHTMAGGAGASWHAMGSEAYWYPDMPNRDNRNSRGSGWGGNPPLSYTDAWNDLERHASWLGLDFVRVEIDMRMYEPERGKFTWDNDQMKTLYRILDWCQANHVDVFFTQMWADVEWNKFDNAPRLQSAPRSVDDFATGLGTLLEHLVKDKGYTSIKWLCMVNEPGGTWGWWIGPDGKSMDLMPAIHALRAEFDKRNLTAIGISGPDCCLGEGTRDFNFDDKAVGAWDSHNYGNYPDETVMRLWAEGAHARGIPFFLSEFGDWAGGKVFEVPDSPSPKSYANQLTNAQKLIEGMNVGVDGFNRWSFTNRGDLDGQWQLVRTFEATRWEYYKRVVPESVPYYTYGIITRFMAKHSGVLKTNCSTPDVEVTALRSPKGNLTIYVLNKSQADEQVELNLANLKAGQTLYKYQVTEGAIEKPEFAMDPLAHFEVTPAGAATTDKVPGESITVYTTYKLANADAGITAD
jgi:hypothetical protein